MIAGRPPAGICQAQQVGDEDLPADEDQDDRERVFQIGEALDHRGEREVERAQTQDREDVRGVDDEGSVVMAKIAGTLSTAKITSATFDQHQRQQQRRQHSDGRPVVGSGLRTKKRSPCGSWVTRRLLRMKRRSGSWIRPRHPRRPSSIFTPVIDQEGGEQGQHPAELMHQGGAEADHQAAQQDDAEDAPEQHAVLVAASGMRSRRR